MVRTSFVSVAPKGCYFADSSDQMARIASSSPRPSGTVVLGKLAKNQRMFSLGDRIVPLPGI